MRFARRVQGLIVVLGLLLGLASSSTPARADVLGRLVTAADEQTGGTPPPQQPPDLTVWAGQARATSLPELLQVTVRQAPALASARIDIAIAEAQIQQTWARNDWQLSGQAVVEVRENPLEHYVTNISAGVAIGRAFSTGGSFSVGPSSSYARNTGTPGRGADYAYWTNSIDLDLKQPLLRGGGRAVFEAAEAKATLARDAAVLARRQTAIETVQTVVSAYWDLVLAERSVAITQASLDLARERLRVTTIGAQGGKIARSEIPAVLQIIATREEDVLNGQLTVLDRSIALRRAAGLPIGTGELGLQVATDVETKDHDLDMTALLERAYTASPELAQLAKQDAQAQIDIEVTENGLLPQLDAELRLGPSGTDGSYATAWGNAVKLDGVSVRGTLTYNQSLGRNDIRGRLREQQQQRFKLKVNATDLRSQLAQSMARAVAQIELARRRATLSQQAIDLANENIKIETDRFNLGKSTNFDVLNRQEDLRQAELRKTQALIDWHKAEAVVHALTGDILPMYGISLE